jgi:alpha-tubulin suppressor-like RCC1 family protein
VAVGLNNNGQCDAIDWADISQVATGHYHTVGLKSDNTVVAVGLNTDGQCNVDEWNLS